MRIFKEGTIKYNNPIKFSCEKCGCEFESEEDEYWIDNSICLTTYPSQYYVYSNCPTCHKICKTTKTTKIEQFTTTFASNIKPMTNKHVKKSINVFGSSL